MTGKWKGLALGFLVIMGSFTLVILIARDVLNTPKPTVPAAAGNSVRKWLKTFYRSFIKPYRMPEKQISQAKSDRCSDGDQH